MRIIAGSMRGRRIEAPGGVSTRPTVDRVRESLMSSVFSARGGFEGAVVLDAFAGSGALGLEALSRGARVAVFCDNDEGAQRVLKRNLALAPTGSARLARVDILKQLPPAAGDPFDLVFLDPPYAVDPADVAALLVRLEAAGLLAPGALATYEHAKSFDSSVDGALHALPWRQVKRKAYGSTAIDLLRRG
ncbi:16S rRNA (guanine(966)-N(2))-methyltransferase RsmD [Curtanaerobium respiraculi]|uniref:16S rRNA (guanine(966)-N(2))-methyltransferase RsmD n=1 Tax=Curtanaerobium respiraculi TaxID=2949669 RepID=UPI0024B3C1AD|nr:16S rRNA (guanine(966)-N(2))-methyltransferase RsmD [Curtanaerobium respiraculi]